ncbi:MAG: glycerol uptake facilitator protein [Phycisphaerae bacterium]|nr:MAG: aquaporin [Planctomycetia bacterium]GJQ27684.1 MAG: glycerol uptake facilitator protein [Phycisphaerae bacterium]
MKSTSKTVLGAICLGEFIGTFLLVLFGTATVAVAVLFNAHVGLLQVAVVWGIGVTLAIYATRHLSCAHLNPAVSLGMVLAGRMNLRLLPWYWLAQLAGGIAAGATVLLLFGSAIGDFEHARGIVRGAPGSVQTAMIFGEYFPHPGLAASGLGATISIAILAEALGTFLLVTMVFSLTEGCNVGRPADGLAPVFIGATVAAIISILAPLTQAGLNPARDFGPRLVAFLAGWDGVAIPGPRGGFFLVYVAAPLVGGALSAIGFRYGLQPLMDSRTTAVTGACSNGEIDMSNSADLPQIAVAAQHNQPSEGNVTVACNLVKARFGGM